MTNNPTPELFDGNRPHAEMPARLHIAAMLFSAHIATGAPHNSDRMIFHMLTYADALIAQHNATVSNGK